MKRVLKYGARRAKEQKVNEQNTTSSLILSSFRRNSDALFTFASTGSEALIAMLCSRNKGRNSHAIYN